ncbi:Kynurenine formamidase [Entomortierella beljakovae]|nr:Kynurenine formamidase [Entomortierella beljakovae]
MSTINDIVYAPVSHWEKHTLDLYHPSTPHGSNGPLIVFIHGGAWRTGDKSEFVEMARNLAASTRNSVAVVNYTLSIASVKGNPSSVPLEAQHPKHVQDVATAIGYLYKHAQDYGGYNREQIILVGHSAGGHITGLLALRPDLYLEPVEAQLGLLKGTLHSAVSGVIGVEGIYNVDALLKRWPSYRDFIVQAFGENPEALVCGSPDGQRIPDSEPFTIPRYAVIQSNQDELVEREQATEYFSYLQSVASAADTDKLVLEFGDWGKHDDMLQTSQFIETITKHVQTFK